MKPAALLLLALPAMAAPPASVRVATFNASLNRTDIGGELPVLLGNGNLPRARQVAEIIQRVRPDLLLLNEFDYVAGGTAPGLFQGNYLDAPQAPGLAGISYAHRYAGPVNTGIHSGQDLDNNGVVDSTAGDDAYGNDALGFGRWPGQYGMVIYSKFPLVGAPRAFQRFLWKNMPGALLPPGNFYTATELNVLRLSSKSHWDVSLDLGSGCIAHLLASHPTPPVFDGPEDRNGRRNYDEIRLWADYLNPANGYLRDDANVTPAFLPATERFVICGDMNSDPNDGDGLNHAIRQLLQHPRVDATYTPSSAVGGQDTAAFGGNLRVDYALPSREGWRILGGGVFWPAAGEPGAAAAGGGDHRLVWMDLAPIPALADAVAGYAAVAAGGMLRLRWTGKAAYRYAVASSAALAGPWTPEPAGLAGPAAGGGWEFSAAPIPGERRFYRVEVSWP